MAFALPARGNEFLGVPYDKWLHFETSTLMSVTTIQLERLWNREDPLHLLPLGLVVAANAAKESYDVLQPGGMWDPKDLATGTLGGLFGIGLAEAWQPATTPVGRGHSPIVAGFCSLLIPGGGHFYNETPKKGWAYLGLELGVLFPLLSITASDKPATYYGTIGAFGLLKLLDIIDATTSASASTALSFERGPDRTHLALHLSFR